MSKYHKIDTVYKRDPETKFKTLLMGEWSRPEFGYLADCQWVFTEKVDGTNVRLVIEDGKVTPAGKSDKDILRQPLHERLLERIADNPSLGSRFPDGAVLYGEGYGSKIQKMGKYYRDDQDFVLFDVRVGPWWLQRRDIVSIAEEFGFDVVPIIGTGNLHDMIKMAQNGFNSYWGDFPAEGIIARPSLELHDRSGRRIITKIKTKDFH